MDKFEFERLLNENKGGIWRLCRMYATETERRKDMYQDVLLQIWKSLPAYKSHSAISTWIYRITVNTCIKASLKIRRYEKEISLNEFEMQIQVLQEDDKERYEALYLCISKLGNIDKVLVGLYLEEQAYKEIGEMLGISENHVAVKLNRIKKSLQSCMVLI